MTQTSDILAKFELLTGDTTELSSTEELALANRIYRKVLGERPWEFLKKEATGTTSVSVPYVTLPSDFSNITESATSDGIQDKYVLVDNSPYKLVNFADRRNYTDMDGFCYIDIVNSKLYFTLQPTSAKTYSFDYIYVPADLNTDTGLTASTPVFPSRFWDIISYGMAAEDFDIQLFEKSKSYSQESTIKYLEALADLCLYNSTLILN